MTLGFLSTVFIVPSVLSFIGSQATLPSLFIISIYFLQISLEANHGLFADLIIANNEVPFVKASLYSVFFSMVLTIILLTTSNWGLLAVVLAPFIVQAMYQNWRWPVWILKEFNYNILEFFQMGFIFIHHKILNYIKK